MIKVQTQNFSIENEINQLLHRNSNVGAISSFVGIVEINLEIKTLFL